GNVVRGGADYYFRLTSVRKHAETGNIRCACHGLPSRLKNLIYHRIEATDRSDWRALVYFFEWPVKNDERAIMVYPRSPLWSRSPVQSAIQTHPVGAPVRHLRRIKLPPDRRPIRERLSPWLRRPDHAERARCDCDRCAARTAVCRTYWRSRRMAPRDCPV